MVPELWGLGANDKDGRKGLEFLGKFRISGVWLVENEMSQKLISD